MSYPNYSKKAFIWLYSPTISTLLKIVLGVLLGTLFLRLDGIINLNNLYIGGAQGDSGLIIWIIKSNIRDLFTLPLFSTKIFYPYGGTLGWSDNLIIPSIFIKSLLSLGFPFLTAYNLTLIGSFFLNGFCTALLVYRLTGNLVSAILSGYSFMGLPYFLGHLGHPQLQFAFWLPMIISTALKILSKSSFLNGLLFGLVICGAFLTTPMYAVCGVTFVAIIISGLLIYKGKLFYSKLRFNSYSAIGILFGLLPAYPALKGYLEVKKIFGPRFIYEPYFFSANIGSYFASSQWNRFFSFTSEFTHPEAFLFIGVVPILLLLFSFKNLINTPIKYHLLIFFGFSLLGLIFSYRSDPLGRYGSAINMWIALGFLVFSIYKLGKEEEKFHNTAITNRGLIIILLLCGFVFLFLSFGPMGNVVQDHLPVGLYTIAYKFIPGFDSIRAVGRIGAVSLLCFVIIAGFGFCHLSKKYQYFALLLLPFSLIVNLPKIYPLELMPLTPPIIRGLSFADKDSASIILPITKYHTKKDDDESIIWDEYAHRNVAAMLWGHDLNINVVNGYSGIRPPLTYDLIQGLENFPDEISLNKLRGILGLRYIIYMPFNTNLSESILPRLKKFPESLRIITSSPDGSFVLELKHHHIVNSPIKLIGPPEPNGDYVIKLKLISHGSDKKLSLSRIEKGVDTIIDSLLIKKGSLPREVSIPLPLSNSSMEPIEYVLSGDPGLVIDDISRKKRNK